MHSEAREVIRRVIEKCDEEARTGQLRHVLSQRNARVQDYTGVSVFTVTKIRKEANEAGESTLITPGKKRPYSEDKKFHMDDFDRRVVRDTIREFYLVRKQVPTVSKLLVAIKEKIDFHWGRETLRHLLHEMGFNFQRCKKMRQILIERPDIVNWRCRYLRDIQLFRHENKKIFYLDETWVDNNLTFGKCWSSNEVHGVLTNTSSSNRLIVVSAGSKEGFLAGCTLIFKAGKATGDYHGQMNSTNFQKWVEEKLIPSLPENSAIVMDNAPYHCIQENKPPTKYAVKKDMVEWLQKNRIQCSLEMKKFALYELIEKHKPREKVYHIDVELKKRGHSVLRLPPYMCDLNPIELAWAKVKRVVKEQNVKADLSLTNLENATKAAIESVSVIDWEGFTNHTLKIEQDYWEKDGIMEDVVDRFVIELGGFVSDESEAEESDYAEPQLDDDEELAQPLPCTSFAP